MCQCLGLFSAVFKTVIFLLAAGDVTKLVASFLIPHTPTRPLSPRLSVPTEDDRNISTSKSVFQPFSDLMNNMDDAIDDFFNKRMGNGEIFYGKRKYKPSGKVEGEYNGFGLSDKMRIDITRQRKEEFLAAKRRQLEELHD